MEPRYNELEDLTSVAVFVVEVSHYERQTLWEIFAKDAPSPRHPLLDWKDCNRGWSLTIGELDGRPVCICVFGATLNGKHVLFYEPTSTVVDWDQIRKWFKENCWPLWDNGTRRAHCDAFNFHHCLEVVRYDTTRS